jgi:hypothetical protein
MDIAVTPSNPVAMLFYNGVHDPAPNRCGGSGPAQLSLALLCDHFQEFPDGDERALGLYQRFKWRVIGRLPREGWTLTSADIERTIADLEEQR